VPGSSLRFRRGSRPLGQHRVLATAQPGPSVQRAGHTKPPVYEQIRFFLRQFLQKATRTDLVCFKALELPHRPGQ
jgi:hypothetical protein